MSRAPMLPIKSLVFAVATLTLLAEAEGRVLLAAEEGEELGSPVCEEFYDKWEVPGLPAAMLATGGIGRELMAAQDCVEKGDAATACKHWSKVIEVTDTLGPPFNEDRAGIEQMMAEQECDSVAPDADPGSTPQDTTPDSP